MPEPAIQTFFERYADAYRSSDAETIAAHYTLPCAISDGLGRQVFDRAETPARHPA